MQYDRYYYSVLNKQEKEVYKLIYKGIENLDTSIKISTTSCVGINFSDIIQKILLDNPHIFYIDQTSFKIETSLFDTILYFNYLYSVAEIKKLRIKINNVVNSMLKQVVGSTDYEKEKAVHDLICNNVAYSHVAADNLQKYSAVSGTILGVLFYKSAVCQGIALTVKLLLNMLDIKCIVALGTLENVGHAWNIVKINGQSYHLDVTNDLKALSGVMSYNFFNLTDEQILKTHIVKWKYPVCNFTDYNYFVYEKLIAYTKTDIEKIVNSSILNGKNYVRFKFLGNTSLECARQYAISLLHFKEVTFYENKEHNTVLITWTKKGLLNKIFI